MAKKGWGDAAIHEEWALWADSIAERGVIPNVRSRPQVIEYALLKLKESLEGKGALEDIRAELKKIRDSIEKRK